MTDTPSIAAELGNVYRAPRADYVAGGGVRISLLESMQATQADGKPPSRARRGVYSGWPSFVRTIYP